MTFRLALAYFRRRKLRAVLTTLSVAVAIAALVAVHGLNGSIDYVTGELAGLLGGRAQLEVKSPQTGMSDSMLAQVQKTDGIQTAVPYVQSAAQVDKLPGFTSVMGIVSGEDEKIRTYQLAEGRLPAVGQREIAVPKELLRRHSWKLGDTLQIQTMKGMQDYRLTGILEDSGVARANGGAMVFMPMDTAQKAFGLEGKISNISVILKDPNDLATVQKALQDSLGSAIQVQTPVGRNKDTDQLLGLIKSLNNVYGLMGLFLTLFVMYNSMGVAVSEQRGQIGILRALGWLQWETRRLIITQALIIGMVGCSLGLVLGTFMAQGLLGSVSEFLREVTKINIPRIRLTGTEYVLTWVLGVLSCLISAWLPARKAASIAPIETMDSRYVKGERVYARWRVIVGSLLMTGSWASSLYGKNVFFVQVSLVGILIGAVVLMPPVLIYILKVLEPLAEKLFGPTGRMGVGSFRRAPRRTVITGMPIVLGLGLAFGFLGLIESFNKTVDNWAKEQVSPDIIISQGFRTGAGDEAALPDELLERVRKVDGVGVVAATRAAGFVMNGRPVDMALFDVAEWRKFTSPPVIEPDKEQALDALQRRGQIWISQSLALRYGLQKGQELAIPTPSGTVEFPIAAITKDYFSYNGTVHMNRQDYIQYWGDHSIDYIYVTVRSGMLPSQVRNRVEEDLRGNYRVTAALASDFREDLLKMTGSIGRIFDLVLIVALLVVAVGIINSLLISVVERSREIGILRSLGLKRGQIRGLFIIEVGSLVITGIILSIPVAAGILASGVVFYKNAIGWVLDIYVPWVDNIGITAVMALIASLSTLYPAWLASRINPVQALRSE